MIKFCAAKVVQIEQITKFYLSYFEMQPIFDLFLKVKSTRGRHLVIEPPPNYDKIYTL